MGSFYMGDWQRLNNWLKEYIDEMLQKYFNGDGEGSMFTKIKHYLNKISLNHSSELFDNQLSIIAERLLLTGAYLFGSELTKADLSLFSVLVQYFEESEKTLENQAYVGKGKKKIYEEDLDEIVGFKEDRGKGSTSNSNLNDAYIDWRIEIIYEFVERIKRHLGFVNNQEWKSLQVEPWILNYETEKNFSEKYDGPFQVKTDELTDLDKLLDYNKFTHAVSIFFGKKRLEKSSSSKMIGKVKDALKGKSKPEIEDFDELIQKIVKKLFNFLEDHIFVERERKGYGTIALNAIAAYLCNLGGEFKEMAREIANETIKEYNENKIEKEVLKAIREAWDIEKAQKKNEGKSNVNKLFEIEEDDLDIMGEF
uniref:Uncharacterized protein n=1 Tax=Meloidogyne javanica TaxID=6303 RepID=A0A915MZ83_MELJA